VIRNAVAKMPGIQAPAKLIGAFFTVSLLLFAVTGGNMFQTWSAADVTREYFGVPTWLTGLILAGCAGVVILGGIKRIGNVTGLLVPLKCGIYVLCGLYVIVLHAQELPGLVKLIFVSAFSKSQAAGAFTGGVMGNAFLWGMKRALFSSEAGLGTAPIAHAAVKTPEPVTEGVVAGLEPFIDTMFVCTVTGLVLLCSGIWNRAPAAPWDAAPPFVQVAPGQWQPQLDAPPPLAAGRWAEGAPVFAVAEVGDARKRVYGTVHLGADGAARLDWQPLAATAEPHAAEPGLFADYRGATLVAKSFDSVHEGFGRWLITIVVWVFALSTVISYGYYGEQGVIYLFGPGAVTAYRWLWCFAAAGACFGFIRTSVQLDAISTVGMGFMYLVNLPLMLVLGARAMAAYKDYFRRLGSGQIKRA
jgi:AGCS family alanine or glycine:cation symporter